MDPFTSNLRQENLAAMMERFDQTLESQILVEEVAKDEVSKYGIVDIDGASLSFGEFCKIKRVVEKPKIEQAPSELELETALNLSEFASHDDFFEAQKGDKYLE